MPETQSCKKKEAFEKECPNGGIGGGMGERTRRHAGSQRWVQQQFCQHSVQVVSAREQALFLLLGMHPDAPRLGAPDPFAAPCPSLCSLHAACPPSPDFANCLECDTNGIVSTCLTCNNLALGVNPAYNCTGAGWLWSGSGLPPCGGTALQGTALPGLLPCGG